MRRSKTELKIRKKKVKFNTAPTAQIEDPQCVCRICMSDVDGLENPLLAPCSCKGNNESGVLLNLV